MATAAEGVEGAAAAAAAEGAASRKGKGKLVLLLVAVLALGGAGAAAFLLGLVPGGKAPAGGHGAAEEGAASAGAHGAGGAMRPLDPFLANLADESGTRYLKMTLQVEFAGPEPPGQLDARMPQIRDVILTLVTSKTFADIRTPDGKERLREDVIDRMNHVLQADAVKSVYFTEFIVQ
ncbi:MAG: flagellar basal body-associated FliL family protein [Thermodesulfobacteriota bacterium]